MRLFLTQSVLSQPTYDRLASMLRTSTAPLPVLDLVRNAQEAYTHPESRLMREFPQLVGSLLLDSVAVGHIRPDYSQPDALSAYGLVPIIPTIPRTSSMSQSGFFNKSRSGVKRTYPGSPGGEPYLDARQALGLTYTDNQGSDQLVAVASAGIPRDGGIGNVLQIVQIQNVSGITRNSPDQFNRIFRSGLEWRHTLVHAWEQIGHSIDADYISIQSLRNNQWKSLRGRKKPTGAYDTVAEQRGYSQSPDTGDWVKPVSAIPPTPRSRIGVRQHIAAFFFAIR